MLNKKLLLIGKYSFISTNIYSKLKKKLSIKKISFEQFKKISKIKLNKFDFVCNCSINKRYVNEKYKESNDIDFYVAKKLKNLSSKFIFLSSRKVYPKKANLKESTTPEPRENYSKNKIITENKIRSFSDNKILILRISNLIGKPLKKTKRKVSITFIDNFFSYKKNQKILYENHFKDFLSINQFSKIFFEILKANLDGVFNISLGKKVYVSELIKVLNKNRSIKFKKIKIFKKDSFYLNNQKLKKKIKFKITKKELLNYCSKI